MTFKDATDRLSGCVMLKEIAQALGVTENTVARARLDPGSASYRNPPAGWEAAIAALAESKGSELAQLADELKRSARGPERA